MPSRRYDLVCEDSLSDSMKQRLMRQRIRSVSLTRKQSDEAETSTNIYSELTVVKSPRAPLYEVQYIKTKKDGIKQVPVLRQLPKKIYGKGGRDKTHKTKKNEEDRSELDDTGSGIESFTGSVTSDKSDTKTDDMVGLRVIACNKKDGLYYPGSVASHLEATFAVVNFNFNKRQKVRTHMIIPMSGAIPRPELAPGDFVLVKVFKQHVSLDCYVPAIIEFVPEDFRAHAKFYSVLMYNGQRASTMRKFIVKIGRSRFEVAVNYIAHIQNVEREKQRALNDITPRSKESKSSKTTSDRSDRSEDGISDQSSIRSSDRSSVTSGSERGRKKKQRLTQKLVHKQTDHKRSKSRNEKKSRKPSRSSSRSSSRSKSVSRSRSKSRSTSRSTSRSRSRSRSRSASDTSHSRSSVNTNTSSKRSNRPNSRSKRRGSKTSSRKRSTSRSNSSSRSRSRSKSGKKHSRSKNSSRSSPDKGKENLQSRSRRRSDSRSNTSRSRSYSSSRTRSSRSRSGSRSEVSLKSDDPSRKSRSKTQRRRRSSSGSSTVKSRSRSQSNEDSQDRTPRASPIERPVNPISKPRPSSGSPDIHRTSESRQFSARKSDKSSNRSQLISGSLAVQMDEKDQVIGDLQHQLNKQLSKQLRQERRLIRQARKINKIQQKLKHSDNNESLGSDKMDRSRNFKSSSDTDGSPRRRKESPDGTSYRDSPDVVSMRRSLQGLEFDKEVLCRWSDDGWYYRGRVLKTRDSRYIVMDNMGHLEDVPHEDVIAEDGDRTDGLQPQDSVIALHPKYVFSYAPGEVLHVYDNGNVKVEFYDGSLSKVAPGEVYRIPREKCKADVEYIVDKEKALLGKSVVARDDPSGLYRLGVVDSRVGMGQQYYLKWLDGDMCKQSSTHIFEVALRKTGEGDLEHVLAPIESGCILYKPAVVLQREPLLLQFCDGYSNTEARKEQCFYITKEYYTNAVEFLVSRQSGSRP